jgi:hypothetical protein
LSGSTTELLADLQSLKVRERADIGSRRDA